MAIALRVWSIVSAFSAGTFVISSISIGIADLFWFFIDSRATSNLTLTDESDSKVVQVFCAISFGDCAKTLPANVLISSILEVDAAIKAGGGVF